MDVKEAAVAYLPEVAPQAFETDVPPGYKRTEVGVIPEDWNAPAIASIIDEISMGPFGSDIKVSNFTSQGVPVLNGANVATEQLVEEFTNFVTPSKARSLKKAVARRGDVVVTHRGTIGQISYIPDEASFEHYVISQSQFRVHFFSRTVLPAWIVRYFHSDCGSRCLLNGKGHTGVPAIAQPTTMFRGLHVPLPPIEEQRAIATTLSDADALIAALQRLIAKKRAIKQGTMQTLLTGRQRLPGFTGAWETKPLGDVTHIKTGSRNNQDNVSTGAYPFFVRSEHVERINSYAYDCEAILVPGEGKIGEIFHYISGRFDVHQRVYAITQFATDVCGKFIYFYMKQHFGAHALQNTVKATVDSLRLPTFQNFEMHVPPTRNEQTAIATVLADMDAEIEALEARLAKTRALKAGMMQQLLTGRIRLVRPKEMTHA